MGPSISKKEKASIQANFSTQMRLTVFSETSLSNANLLCVRD